MVAKRGQSGRTSRVREGSAKGAESSAPELAPKEDLPAFPVVGIGASAGGLDAFREFFSRMPPDSGIAFVLVQHLHPGHESLIAEILQQHLALPVEQVEHGVAIAPDHIYMIPPGHDMSIREGVLCLSPQDRRGVSLPVDHFFRSLAYDRQRAAIGIVLTGNGSDGTQGIRAIKEVGGMAMVQDPATAEFDGMPRSAAATGMADFVLPIQQMSEALIRYVGHPYLNPDSRGEALLERADDHLIQIFSLLRVQTGYDFRFYKKATLLRRIERRLGLHGMRNPEEYITLLHKNSEEAKALFKDLLIGVTTFFRDPEAMDTLARDIIPNMVENAREDGIRIWIPGCATGEEAYSFTILLLEEFARQDKPAKIQVFATDIDEDGLGLARSGRYPDSIEADVSPERLKTFFKKEQGAYRISGDVRNCITFALQNVISDPPFSKLDLVSCRNLLIYLEPETQKTLFQVFHFALKAEGILFLGPSESVGRGSDLFEPVSGKWRIYRRTGPTRLGELGAANPAPERHSYAEGLSPRRPGAGIASAGDLAKRFLLEHCSPPAALVTHRGHVLYIHGNTENFLIQPTGEPTHDILAMARRGLSGKLRTALRQAVEKNEAVRAEGFRSTREGGMQRAAVTVTPVGGRSERLFMVTFEELREIAPPPKLAGAEGVPDDAVVRQLENDLQVARADLQTTIEETEISNEELKASNEEIKSMNEELQSANEELENSKEQLQSLNEELTAINAQLQEKVKEAERADKAKSGFLAAMSHDLRTPLNGILGYSEAILVGAAGPLGEERTREYIANINAAGKHLLALINDVLDLSALDADKVSLHDEPLSPEAIAQDSLQLVRGLAQQNKVDVTLAAPERLPMLRADGRRVIQILVNLLGNAIKFSTPGSRVELKIELDKERHLSFRVADEGPGMDASQLKVALEPFSRIDNMVNRSKGGTGLGLPIARRLTAAHGGHLSIDSAPGKGTTVTATFPAGRLVDVRGGGRR